MSTRQSLIVGMKDLPDSLNLSWAQLDEQFCVLRMSQAFTAVANALRRKSLINPLANCLVLLMLNYAPI